MRLLAIKAFQTLVTLSLTLNAQIVFAGKCQSLSASSKFEWIVDKHVTPPYRALRTPGSIHKISFNVSDKAPSSSATFSVHQRSDADPVIEPYFKQLLDQARKSDTEVLFVLLKVSDTEKYLMVVSGSAQKVPVGFALLDKLAKHVVELKAQTVYMVHNHPLKETDGLNSNPSFSYSDLNLYTIFKNRLAGLSVDLNFIVIPDGSLRGENYDDVYFETVNAEGFE